MNTFMIPISTARSLICGRTARERGGYNNGLYGFEERDEGTLARIRTAAVEGFQRVLRPLAEGLIYEQPLR